MAISQVQCNASNGIIEHSRLYRVGENLAWGYSDPFTGWYDREKKDYEKGNTDEAGHYLNIVRNSSTATGFAINDADDTLHSICHEQSFLITTGSEIKHTVSEYEQRFNAYYDEVQSNLKQAKEVLKQAQENYDALFPPAKSLPFQS